MTVIRVEASFIGGFVALGLIVASIIFGFTLDVFFSVAMAGLGVAAILYTTSNILRYYRTDQYAAAATALFASVALMFWYVLRILITARRENARGGEELKGWI